MCILGWRCLWEREWLEGDLGTTGMKSWLAWKEWWGRGSSSPGSRGFVEALRESAGKWIRWNLGRPRSSTAAVFLKKFEHVVPHKARSCLLIMVDYPQMFFLKLSGSYEVSWEYNRTCWPPEKKSQIRNRMIDNFERSADALSPRAAGSPWCTGNPCFLERLESAVAKITTFGFQKPRMVLRHFLSQTYT